jgi:hypothetical protein
MNSPALKKRNSAAIKRIRVIGKHRRLRTPEYVFAQRNEGVDVDVSRPEPKAKVLTGRAKLISDIKEKLMQTMPKRLKLTITKNQLNALAKIKAQGIPA